MLHRMRKRILEKRWALLIVDESHNIRCTKKRSEPEKTKAVLDVASKVNRIILLSGTPSLSRPYDIFHQINILWPGLLGKDKYEFAKNYCSLKLVRGSQGKMFKDFSKGIRLEELNVLLKQTVMIRRLKEHVLLQLPPKRRQVIRLMLKGSDIILAKTASRAGNMICMDSRHQNESVMKCCAFQADSDGDETSEILNECDDKNVFHKTSRELYYQEIGIAKLSGFHEWLANHPIFTDSEGASNLDLDLSSQKMLIFAHHLKVLDGVQEFVCEKGIEFVRIDGRTCSRDRQSAVQSFRSSAEVKIAIIGITAGGVGLDFSSAQNVVFLELPKSASEMLQAEDRAHRRGQSNAVNIYIFCAKDTSDESHWQNLNKSLYRVSSLMNGINDAIQEMEVDRVFYLDLARESSHYGTSECNAAGFLGVGTSDLNCIGTSGNASGDNGLLDNTVSDVTPFSIINSLNSQDTAIIWSKQAIKTCCVASEESEARSNEKIEGHASLNQIVSQKFEVDMVDDPDTAEHSPYKILEINSAAMKTRKSRRVSTCKLNDSHDKIEFLENVTHEAISFSIAKPAIFQNDPVDRNIQAEKMNSISSETVEPEATEVTEMDAIDAVQTNSLRFEVSQYTGRIHLYVCIPGKDLRPRPLFENFRPEELESVIFPATDINKEKPPKRIQENPAYHDIFLAFIKEWNNLRPLEQKKLLGKPLQLPLNLELSYLKENVNHGSGGLLKGGSKRRVTPLCDISHPLPANAFLKKITLRSGCMKKEKEYTQAWMTMTDEPLCKLCQKPCDGKHAKVPEYFEDLFCDLSCYEEYRIRTSQRYLREALFQTEHGVCTQCKLDCHKLVESIRPLSAMKRREYIEKVAPKVAQYKSLLDKLVHEPTEGNAWHADHKVPVYKGGGECRMENMRTLCVACHSDVTSAQQLERRLTRIKAKEQLRVITSELKESGSTDQTADHNLEESTIEDDLLIKVPGSAYSKKKDTNIGSEQKNSPIGE